MRCLRRSTFGFIALACLSACRNTGKSPAEPAPVVPVPSPTPTADNAPAPAPSAASLAGEKFTATVRIDEKPDGKKFQGVWLEREGGERWVIAYRPDELWKPFAGDRVEVTGERYEPKGQRLSAQHFRVFTLRALDDKTIATFVEVGPEQTLSGRLSDEPWPKGDKLEGEVAVRYATGDGVKHLIVNTALVADAPRGEPIELRARRVVYSRFVAHVGSEHLWVVEVVR